MGINLSKIKELKSGNVSAKSGGISIDAIKRLRSGEPAKLIAKDSSNDIDMLRAETLPARQAMARQNAERTKTIIPNEPTAAKTSDDFASKSKIEQVFEALGKIPESLLNKDDRRKITANIDKAIWGEQGTTPEEKSQFLKETWLDNEVVPVYKEDTVQNKIRKNVANVGLNLVGNVGSAIGQTMMQTVSAIDDLVNGRELDFSQKDFMKDIAPDEWDKALTEYGKLHPGQEQAARLLIQTITDPGTVIGGAGVADDLAKAGLIGKASRPSTEFVKLAGERQSGFKLPKTQVDDAVSSVDDVLPDAKPVEAVQPKIEPENVQTSLPKPEPPKTSQRLEVLKKIRTSVKEGTDEYDALSDSIARMEKELQDEITTPRPQESEKIAEELRGLSKEEMQPVSAQKTIGNEDIAPTNKKDSTVSQKKTTMAEREVSTAGKDALISDRKVKAYQFENPEVKDYYQTYAKYILDDEFVPNAQEARITEVMAKLKADTGLQPAAVKDALERLIANKGQENVAAAKRVELVIDDMLSNGFESVRGERVNPIDDYIRIKSEIEGREIIPRTENTLDDIPAEGNYAKPVEKNALDAFKGAQPGELDYKPVGVGLQTQIVTEVPKGQAPPFKYADPELERIHVQNKGIRTDTLAQKAVKGFSELKDMFSRPIKTLPVKGNEQLYYGRNGLINLTKARNKAGDETTRIIKDITKIFKKDKNAFDMFQRKVLLDDLAQEVKLGNALPNKWTPETVTSELKRLDDLMPDSVKDAIAKRKQHWDSVKNRYIKAMEDVGVNMEGRLEKEDYFRHQVLDYMDMKNAVSGVGRKMQVPANRGFTKGRTGEYVGDINTDYIQAEYEVMAQMLHDTEIADTIKFIDKNKNIVDKVKADAKVQGIEDWHKAIPEGYTTWQPREGNVFYMYKPVAEEIVEGALSLRGMSLSGIKDPKIKVVLEDILNDLANQKEVLALGGKRKEFVIPQEVADTLNNMAKNQPTSVPAKFFQDAHTLWKRWILYLNPRNAFKYGTRNTVGDLDAVIAGNPSGVTKTLRSMVELKDAMSNGNFTPELKSFYDLGGYQATQAAQEISQASKLKPFEAFRDNLTVGEKIMKPIKNYEAFMSDANAYREMTLRYGSYLDYLDQLKAGKLKNYGASKKSIIDALETNEEKAYKLADDLLGAYDDVSEAGKFLRRQFIPFYSWLETNFKRYKQLFANSVSTGDVGATTKTAAGIGAKAGLSVARKVGGIFALTGVLAAWNTLKYPELEDTLPADVKSKPHVILGQDKDGNTIYFSRLGSLNDFAEWFGLDNAWQDGMDILNGKKTIIEQLEDMAKSPINKFATGIRPEIKTTVELLTGQRFYPDIFKRGNIRDRGQYFAQSLGLGNEYNQIAGKPTKSYEASIADIFTYKSNPEEAAYWTSLDLKNKYQKRTTGGSYPMDDKANALYNYKLALRYDDKEAQGKYMKLYESFGGNSQQTIGSVLNMSPYYGISKDEINAYKFSMTDKQKNSLKLAEDYFVKLVESELTNKRPMSEGTRLMIDIYKKTYETKQFPKVASNSMTYKGKTYKLTSEEVAEFQNRINDRLYKKADDLAKNPDFKKKPYDKQAEQLSDALNSVVESERNKWKIEKYSK